MTAISKSNFKRCALYLVALSFISFLIFYLPNIYFGDYDTALYISYFAKELINFALPVIAAVAITLAALDNTKKRALVYALCFAAVPVPYTLPYYYYEFVTDYYNSIEAIILALLMSVLVALAFTAEVFIYHLIMKATIKKGGATTDIRRAPHDLDAPATLGVFFAVLLKYVYETAFELYDVICYFIDYSGSYRIGEIIYIVVTFVLMILFAVATHFVACTVKNKLSTFN